MVKLCCLECGQLNRVAADRLGAGPKCGTCGAHLMNARVQELDPAILAKAANHDEVPLVVDFWAPWCGPCQMMAPEFSKSAQSLVGKARFAKINTEDHPAVSRTYGVRGIPMVAIFGNGRELARQAGLQRADSLTAWIRLSASSMRV